MLSLLTLSILCLIALPVLVLGMMLLSIPFLVIMAVLPWLLRVAAVVLLFRALLDRPFQLSSLIPAAIALLLSMAFR